VLVFARMYGSPQDECTFLPFINARVAEAVFYCVGVIPKDSRGQTLFY
jgi:hypothetical protein